VVDEVAALPRLARSRRSPPPRLGAAAEPAASAGRGVQAAGPAKPSSRPH